MRFYAIHFYVQVCRSPPFPLVTPLVAVGCAPSTTLALEACLYFVGTSKNRCTFCSTENRDRRSWCCLRWQCQVVAPHWSHHRSFVGASETPPVMLEVMSPNWRRLPQGSNWGLFISVDPFLRRRKHFSCGLTIDDNPAFLAPFDATKRSPWRLRVPALSIFWILLGWIICLPLNAAGILWTDSWVPDVHRDTGHYSRCGKTTNEGRGFVTPLCCRVKSRPSRTSAPSFTIIVWCVHEWFLCLWL